MNQPRILPFYMTYPMPFFFPEADPAVRDLEYLQEMYPLDAKKYQKKINRMLDRFDYEGSMIYDEYPDRFALYKMSQDMMTVIRKEDEAEGNEMTPEKREWITDLVQILLFSEIFKRRRSRNDGFLKM